MQSYICLAFGTYATHAIVCMALYSLESSHLFLCYHANSPNYRKNSLVGLVWFLCLLGMQKCEMSLTSKNSATKPMKICWCCVCSAAYPCSDTWHNFASVSPKDVAVSGYHVAASPYGSLLLWQPISLLLVSFTLRVLSGLLEEYNIFVLPSFSGLFHMSQLNWLVSGHTCAIGVPG